MKSAGLCSGCVILIALLVGCKKQPSAEEIEARAVATAQQQKHLRDQARAAQEAAATQAKKSAERARERQAALELKSASDKMFVCCEALAKRGFEERSMPHMKAFDLCEAAHKQGQEFSAVAADARAALGEAPLPPECAQ